MNSYSILKEISPGISLEGMMLKLKLQYFGHLIGKDSDAGRDWGQEEKGTTEDEMAGWHHWLNGRESEWTPGVGDGQGGLACCDSWGLKELDTTERLIWSDSSYCLHTFISSLIMKWSAVFHQSFELCLNCAVIPHFTTLWLFFLHKFNEGKKYCDPPPFISHDSICVTWPLFPPVPGLCITFTGSFFFFLMAVPQAFFPATLFYLIFTSTSILNRKS